MAPAERMAEQRKLVTIMALDVAGYSRASEKDDSAMVAAVVRLRTVIAKAIAPHGGRIFNTAGDGFMIEFSSAISAVAATRALLEAIAEEHGHKAHTVIVCTWDNALYRRHGFRAVPEEVYHRPDEKRLLVAQYSPQPQAAAAL